MQFSVRLSLCLLGFVLAPVFPQPARGQVSSPRRFRAKVLSPNKLQVLWKEPKGEFESYKVIYTTKPDGRQKEVLVSKQEAKLLIEDFDPSKEYNFRIFAVSRGRESRPLQAKHEAAQRSADQVVEFQRRKDSGDTGGNNEISEGKILSRVAGGKAGEQKPGWKKQRRPSVGSLRSSGFKTSPV